jgi:uncharacterized tellurite resistance protein B-like protein
MHRKEYLRYLLIMAAADGGLSREELQLLTDRAIRWGVTDEEFEVLLDEATSGSTELMLPPTAHERFKILRELIWMMGADGHIGDHEKCLFAQLCSRMNISPTEVNQIIDEAIAGRRRGNDV